MHTPALLFPVIPAKAGIQGNRSFIGPWTPAFAGVTGQIQKANRAGWSK